VICSYSKTNEMHQFLKFILLIYLLLASSQQNLFDIFLMLYVQSQAPDDGRKDCPKHAECYYKIK